MIIKNAKMYLRQEGFTICDIDFHKTIETIGKIDKDADIDACGAYLIPGLIDIHTHGAAGCDFSDGDAKGNRVIASFYAAHGVTSYCATIMSLPEDELLDAVTAIRGMECDPQGAQCVGVYLEGPFLAASMSGAQATANLTVPDIGLFHRINEASGNRVKRVGIAPELPGALEFITEASKVCSVSIAHTAADYETAMAGYAQGATSATHLFNCMTGLHHRKPAVIGAAFDSDAYAELICDGIHIHPSVVRMAFRLFQNRLILISDSVRCTGMPDGSYTLGGQTFTMTDGKATMVDGTLSGSSIPLLKAVQNVIAWGVSPQEAIDAATITPARAIGVENDIGSIEVGKRANMLLLDERFQLIQTIMNGEVVSQ